MEAEKKKIAGIGELLWDISSYPLIHKLSI
jgi:hypothetical protein